jgi:hypothetical protein
VSRASYDSADNILPLTQVIATKTTEVNRHHEKASSLKTQLLMNTLKSFTDLSNLKRSVAEQAKMESQHCFEEFLRSKEEEQRRVDNCAQKVRSEEERLRERLKQLEEAQREVAKSNFETTQAERDAFERFLEAERQKAEQKALSVKKQHEMQRLQRAQDELNKREFARQMYDARVRGIETLKLSHESEIRETLKPAKEVAQLSMQQIAAAHATETQRFSSTATQVKSTSHQLAAEHKAHLEALPTNILPSQYRSPSSPMFARSGTYGFEDLEKPKRSSSYVPDLSRRSP